MVRVLQINLNRSRDAHDLMHITASKLKVDICLVSEQNVNKCTGKCWFEDENKDASIYVNTNKITIGKTGKGRGFVWIKTDNMVICSCYISPNCDIEEFSTFLRNLGSKIPKTTNILIGGDFNSKATAWGHNFTDRRGEYLMDWIAEKDLYVLNDGKIPTFVRRDQESFIDLTCCSRNLLSKVVNWRVLQKESLSDHQYISYDLEKTEEQKTESKRKGWLVNKLDKTKLKTKLVEECQGNEGSSADDIIRIVTKACDFSMPKLKTKPNKWRPAYWWTEEISGLRKDCKKARRAVTRGRKRVQQEELITLVEEWKRKRKELKLLIRKEKERKWKILCEEVEEDVWGLGYKIVTKRIRIRQPSLGKELKDHITKTLFPTHNKTTWNLEDIENENVPDFTLEELNEVLKKIKNKKAPGIDGIPPEIVKEMGNTCHEYTLQTMNAILKGGSFPERWKKARVILIPKGNKPFGDPSAYRPLCLLDTFGKLLEGLINNRLVAELNERGGLNDEQYGFRKGKSTVQAIQSVINVALEERRKTLKTRKLCILVTLDVRNAFNSASWIKIVRELQSKNISSYLVRLVQSYLENRKIVTNEGNEIEITAGVPQGSVLGPTLWNVMYDGVLSLELPEGVRTVAYADDLAVLAVAKKEEELERITNLALVKISDWMEDMGLALAPEKTESVLLIGRKKCRPLDIKLLGTAIEQKPYVKYLGVVLDKKMSFGHHIQHVTEKASKLSTSLARLLPRSGGAGEERRRLLCTVIESIILYAAPVWVQGIRIERQKKVLIRVQRSAAIRICRAYRTVSTDAVLLIARTIPITLLLEERAAVFGKSDEQKKAERENTIAQWNEEWKKGTKGQWTRTLLPEIYEWLRRKHGKVTYRLTQVFTGHGCFGTYLHKIKKKVNSNCFYCAEEDDVAHTVFHCKHFKSKKEEAEKKLKKELKTENIINVMLESEVNWDIIAKYLEEIMKEKEEKERDLEKREE